MVRGIGHHGTDPPGGHAVKYATGVVLHPLEAQPISGLVGIIVEHIEARRTFRGTGAVFAAAIVLGHTGIVVACRRVGTPTEFIFIAYAVAVRIIDAVAVTIEVDGHRIGTGAILDIRRDVVVAGTGIEAAPIEAGAVVVIGEHVVIHSRLIGTTGIQTGTVGLVGIRVVVRSRGIGTTGINAAAIVHIGRGVVVR